MDRQRSLVGEFEHDHLEEIACTIRADDERLGRITAWIEIDNNKGMIRCVLDVRITDTVSTGRLMDLHTALS